MMHLTKTASILGIEGFFQQQEAPTQMHEKFATHMEAQGLSFGTRAEYKFRFEIFQKKDYEINIVNNKQDSYRVAHNMFSTMTVDETKKWLGGIPKEMDVKPTTYIAEQTMFDNGKNDAVVDWRTQGGVNDVKNQGGCGSCWAFGATAGTEHSHWRATKSLLDLSEQQLVDCSTQDHGCNGGFHTNAWGYLQYHGQMLTSDYPYSGTDGTCADTDEGTVKVNTWHGVSRGSVSQHKQSLNIGVLSIALAAGNTSFQMYSSGILDDPECPTQIDHAVAMVGYGNEDGKDYWIVRNSWGAGWGDNGYIKIAAQEGDGICGCQNYSYLVSTD